MNDYSSASKVQCAQPVAAASSYFRGGASGWLAVLLQCLLRGAVDDTQVGVNPRRDVLLTGRRVLHVRHPQTTICQLHDQLAARRLDALAAR